MFDSYMMETSLVPHNCNKHSSKYLPLCSAEERFRTT